MVAAKNVGTFERNREVQKAYGGEPACINRARVDRSCRTRVVVSHDPVEPKQDFERYQSTDPLRASAN
jgi:hypothetical protein